MQAQYCHHNQNSQSSQSSHYTSHYKTAHVYASATNSAHTNPLLGQQPNQLATDSINDSFVGLADAAGSNLSDGVSSSNASVLCVLELAGKQTEVTSDMLDAALTQLLAVC